MKKLINTLLAASLLLMLTACSEHLIVPDQGASKQIAITPITSLATKTPVAGTILPDTTPLYVSAYHNDQTSPANYFSGIAFYKENGDNKPWASLTPRYWPIGGNLNFLAYATTASNNVTATWNSTNVASGVELVVGDNRTMRDDLLYGSSNRQTYAENGNPMTLYHANAVVVFKMMIQDANDNYDAQENTGIEITSFKLNNVYYGGTLSISNDPNANPVLSATWQTPLTNQHTAAQVIDLNGNDWIPAALIENDVYDANGKPFGDAYAVFPPQVRTSFTIGYTIHNGYDNNSNPLNKALEYTYNCNVKGDPQDPDLTWDMGNKYIYEIKFNLHKITIAPTVTKWTDNQQSIINVQAQ